mmetsp:Transcript_15502/g.25464  ORF Transcript_15502/g.25464 Transcript_15502/m.25464 type:complete len:97 (+) Transcript_15502:834-1124(+)
MISINKQLWNAYVGRINSIVMQSLGLGKYGMKTTYHNQHKGQEMSNQVRHFSRRSLLRFPWSQLRKKKKEVVDGKASPSLLEGWRAKQCSSRPKNT